MAVDTTARKSSFVLDGVTEDFAFTFCALTSSPGDIKCQVTSGSTTTTLVYNTNYTVSINANGVGGTVSLISAGSIGLGTLLVYRETTNLQESDYDDYNQFPANTLEKDLDRRTLVAQELSEAITRSLRLPISSSIDAELPLPEANKLIGWNSLGTALENKAGLDDAIASAQAAQTAAEAAQAATEAVQASVNETISSLFTGTRGTFTNANLTAGVLTITHNKGLSAPYQVQVIIFDNSGKQVFPDDVTGATNSVAVDLSSYGVLTGTWGYLIIEASSGDLLDVDTDGTLAANSDEKIASQKATKTYADTKAAKGINSDITLLTGLTTALNVAQGGTGRNAALASGVATGTTDITGGGSPTDMTNMSLTLTTKGTKALVFFTGPFESTNPADSYTLYVQLNSDSAITIASGEIGTLATVVSGHYLFTGMTPGSNTIKIRWNAPNTLSQMGLTYGARRLTVLDLD